MNLLKKFAPFLCLIIAIVSVYAMTQTTGVPPWQVVVYTVVITIPCYLILFWKQFDLFFGFAPPKSTVEDHWTAVTSWIGWLILGAMVLINHFARPPSDF